MNCMSNMFALDNPYIAFGEMMERFYVWSIPPAGSLSIDFAQVRSAVKWATKHLVSNRCWCCISYQVALVDNCYRCSTYISIYQVAPVLEYCLSRQTYQ